MGDGAKRHVRVNVKWEPRDLWVGAYWDRRRWFGGFPEAYTASASDVPPEITASRDALAHWETHVYVCVVPLLPIHLSVLTCPKPGECRAGRCPSRSPADA